MILTIYLASSGVACEADRAATPFGGGSASGGDLLKRLLHTTSKTSRIGSFAVAPPGHASGIAVSAVACGQSLFRVSPIVRQPFPEGAIRRPGAWSRRNRERSS